MENVETGEHSIESEASPTLLPLQQPSGRKRKGLPSSEEQLAVDSAIKITNDASLRCKNPYSGFGEHVANKLATYDNYTRSQVEFKISKILYEADMQTLATQSLSSSSQSTYSNVTSPQHFDDTGTYQDL
jgi:hypothetical protein